MNGSEGKIIAWKPFKNVKIKAEFRLAQFQVNVRAQSTCVHKKVSSLFLEFFETILWLELNHAKVMNSTGRNRLSFHGWEVTIAWNFTAAEIDIEWLGLRAVQGNPWSIGSP